MNVFLGFFEAAGYYSGLFHALQKAGYKPQEYFYFDNKFGYSKSKYIYFVILRKLYTSADNVNYWQRNFSKVFFNFFSFFFFIYCLVRFQYFFLSSQSYFFYWSNGFEFKILKFFNRKIVFNFLGSDSRAPFLSGYNTKKDEGTLVKLTRKKIDFLNTFKHKASYVIDLPPTSLLHSVPVIDFYKVGFPKVIQAVPPRKHQGRKVKVLHAPSVLEYKGSAKFRDIVAGLQKELDFEYREVTGVPNSELLQIIQESDLVLDEMYSDSLMAGIACESAWLGTCYVVFGEKLTEMASFYGWNTPNYGREIDAKDIIKRFILDHDLRYEVALRNFKFVTKNWSPDAVVETLMKIANGNVSSDMIIQEKLIGDLCYGWGANRDEIHSMISKLKTYPDIQKYIERLNLDN